MDSNGLIEFYGDDRTVDWQIKLLCRKIGAYRNKIHTVRGVGYKFEK
ncbi:MAG: helix-turn-helix domain-containing protein [Porcipelethomonas sp.]